jgi:hypothetical protein
MQSEPPKALERVVGLLLPPACREEVLGDLCEKYKTPRQYVAIAAQVVPSVILSRIRRTSDAETLVMGAVLVYGSFLAAAWFTGATFLNDQRVFGLLAVPAVLAVVFLMLDDAWALDRNRNPLRLVRAGALGVGAGSIFVAASMPLRAVLLGCAAGLLMISGVRILFQEQTAKLQSAGGPPLITPRTALTLIGTVGIVLAIAVLLVGIGMKPGVVAVIIFFGAVIFGKTRKE